MGYRIWDKNGRHLEHRTADAVQAQALKDYFDEHDPDSDFQIESRTDADRVALLDAREQTAKDQRP